MSQSEDIEAINNYFISQKSKLANSIAATKAAEWDSWYKNLSWWDKNWTSSAYDTARKMRDSFNAAQGYPDLKAQGYDALTTEQVSQTDTEFTRMPSVQYVEPTKQPGQIHATIKQGDSGPDVVAWQKIIKVTADGKFGPATDKATRTWQQQHGITPDGIVGQQTWSVATGTAVEVVPAGMVPPPASLPKVVPTTTTAVKPIVEKAPVMQAGMFDTLANLSLPVKGALALGIVAAGAAYNESQKKKHR